MAWYGLAPIKNGRPGSADEAIRGLERFWDNFVAITGAETVLNALTYGALMAEESEVPVLGLYAPIFGLNPRGAIYKAVAACLPHVGVRRDYFDLEDTLAKACPEFDRIDWPNVKTRLLIGATEVVNGFETVFDSDVNKEMGGSKSVSFCTSNCRSACPGSPRQERCLRSVKPNISRGPATTGTAFTRRIHPCTSSLRNLTRRPTNCGSCASIRSNGRSCPKPMRKSRIVRTN